MRKIRSIPAVSRGGAGYEVASMLVKATSWSQAILIGMGFALATASSSLAQSYDPDVGTGNIVPFHGQAAQGSGARSAPSAYARIVPAAPALRSWNAFDEQPGVIRTDPDPAIRFQLHRESLQGRW